MRREDEEEGTIEQVFDGGLTADHPQAPERTVRVAPSAEGEFNAVQHPLGAIACVQLSDVLFEFDSSIVRPDARPVMKSLARLREEDQRVSPSAMRPLSIFGHADPIGDDDYNKRLSGRRAQAIYALLTRKIDLWEELYQNPHGGDDWRGGGLATMERALGRESGTAARAAVFRDYMDLICVDDEDNPYTLDPAADFLARGADPDGKGDFQGCSEFNPIRVFSRQEQQRFNQPSQRAARNRENAPNRRVVIFLFRAGSHVNPDNWPCPRAKEGTAGCRRRFHADGERRRSPQDERREFATHDDTFACRFYHHRIATLSPCERVLPELLCCKYRGQVVENRDPLASGRLQVVVPGIIEDGPAWAMPAVPYAEFSAGFVMLPPVGANVWVDFEQGDINRPVWSGCFWAEGEAPAEAGQPGVNFIKTETMALVLKDETSGAAAIALQASGHTVVADSGGVTLRSSGGGKVVLQSAAVTINDDGVKVV